MITDLEIYRAANTLVKRCGDLADIEATKRIDAMFEAGDLDGAAVWKRTLKTVDELQVRERPDRSNPFTERDMPPGGALRPGQSDPGRAGTLGHTARSPRVPQ